MSIDTSPPTQPAARWGPGRIAAVVAGGLLALIGAGMVAGGAVLVWANETRRDEAGFFTSPTERFATADYALTHEGVDIAAGRAGDWAPLEGHATVLVRAAGERSVFVGIAREADAAAYLEGVAHSVVEDVDYDPFSAEYTPQPGERSPPAPGGETFWVASAEGSGPQTLTWDVESGTWSLVVMNADGSRGVAADIEFGGKVDFLGWVAAALIGVGALILAIAVALILLAVLRRPGAAGGEPVSATGAVAATGALAGAEAAAPAPYPVALEGEVDAGLSRWLWLVKWFLAIPHYVVLAFLWIAVVVVWVVALFAVVFTGRYPRSLFDFVLGVLRWTWRVSFYAFAIGTDRYPPFSLGAEPDYPARLDVPYPERLGRGRALVKWWLLAIPHYVIVGIFFGNAFVWSVGHAATGSGPSLHFVLVVIAGVILLFRGRYPGEIFELVVGMHRWAYRVAAYALLMRDEYPPFRLRR